MSCQHAEDVCQDCLEKVQATTEDAPPSKRSPTTEKEHSPPEKTMTPQEKRIKTEKEHSPPEKTMTPQEKRIKVLIDSSILAVFGATAFFTAKQFFKSYVKIFDLSLDTINSLLRTIGTRTRKE